MACEGWYVALGSCACSISKVGTSPCESGCTTPRFCWQLRPLRWRLPARRLLRQHRVSSPAPTRGDRRTVNDRATCRFTPRLVPWLRSFPPASTRGGVVWGTARVSRTTGLTRSTRPLAITRYSAGFSPDPPSCGLLNVLSLRTFVAPRGRRQHARPGVSMPLTWGARPCTRRRATRRSPRR